MRNVVIISLLITTIASCIVLLCIGLSPTVANAVGSAHESIPLIRIGGDGATKMENIGAYAFTLNALILFSFSCLFILGVSARYRDKLFYSLNALILGATLFVWFEIYFSHQRFVASQTSHFILGFPESTAWLLYGVWFSGLFLVCLYCFGFRRYVFTSEDEKSFNELVKEYKKESE